MRTAAPEDFEADLNTEDTVGMLLVWFADPVRCLPSLCRSGDRSSLQRGGDAWDRTSGGDHPSTEF